MFYVYHYIVVLSYCYIVLLLVDTHIAYYYRIMMYHVGFLYTHCVLHMVTISMLRDSEETVLNFKCLGYCGFLNCWFLLNLNSANFYSQNLEKVISYSALTKTEPFSEKSTSK